MRKDYLIKSITQYIFFFFLGAFLGYLWEVLLFYVQDGTFCNRGFLYGPWLPVYGVGAVLMLLILRRFQKHPVKVFFSCSASRLFRRTFYRMVPRPSFPPALLGLSRLSTAAWRLYLSLFCTGIRHRRCALGLCVCADCLPFMEKMPVPLQRIFLTLLILAFLFDCAAALIFPNAGHNITFS